MRKFELIVMDLDSTLIDWSDGIAKVSENCKGALLKAAESKIFVAVATGRTLREVILELEVHGLKFGEPIPHFVIPLEKYCYRVVNGKPTEDEGLARWNRERFEEARNAIERIVLPKASQWLQILSDANLMPNQWVLDTKAGWFSLAYDTPEQAKKAEKFLEQFAAPHPELLVNRNFVFVGLVPVNGTKGKAVRFLAEVLGIPTERVMTIGDSINDIDMLNGEHGFFPVAVANAEPEVKDAALKAGGLVTNQPASDGVAEAIEWALRQIQHQV